MERKERIEILSTLSESGIIDDRERTALKETIAEAERLDKVAIGEFIRKIVQSI